MGLRAWGLRAWSLGLRELKLKRYTTAPKARPLGFVAQGSKECQCQTGIGSRVESSRKATGKSKFIVGLPMNEFYFPCLLPAIIHTEISTEPCETSLTTTFVFFRGSSRQVQAFKATIYSIRMIAVVQGRVFPWST